MKSVLALSVLLFVPFLLQAQTEAPITSQALQATGRDMGGGACENNVYNCADTPNPLPPANTVWIEEMTWMDVRDALSAGKRTVIIPTGGVEPNGPWLVTGKHNYVMRANCDAIARELGDALCAPVIELVPEGNIDPPSGHMTSPGTISLRQETYRDMLEDVARSLKAHGFQNIIFIGDSGGNQAGQLAVAQKLTGEWATEGRLSPIAAHVPEYYTYGTVGAYMRENHGLVRGESDGLHDDPVISLNMLVDDPRSIRYEERLAAGLATIDGVSLADRVQAMEWGRQIVDFRARHSAEAIRRHIAMGGSRPPEGTLTTAASGSGPGGGGGGPPPRDPEDMGGGRCSANAYNCASTPNPLPPTTTVWLEEMTWMDVRDALNDGKTTIIISTGGVEPNGPWLVTGKHNYVLRANCEAIARRLGNALCAPVVKLVPEGSIDPPGGHMTSPGTISMRQETFRAMLTDVASSLKVHGFKHIILIGDSGGNTNGMRMVAEELSEAWAGTAHAIHIPEYYDYGSVSRYMAEQGLAGGTRDGLHDDFIITHNMIVDDLRSVRWAERVRLGLATINGVSIADLPVALDWGKQIVDYRARVSADAIDAAILERIVQDREALSEEEKQGG